MKKNTTLILAVIAVVAGVVFGTWIPFPNLIPLYVIPYFVVNGFVGFAILALIGLDAWSGKDFLAKYSRKIHAKGYLVALSAAFFLGLLFMTNNLTLSILYGVVVGYLEWNSKKKK